MTDEKTIQKTQPNLANIMQVLRVITKSVHNFNARLSQLEEALKDTPRKRKKSLNDWTLKIMSWNANSLLKWKLELDHYLTAHAVDIALISETHCTQKFSIHKSVNYKVYNTFHPSGKARGGTTIYIRSRLHHDPGICISTLEMQLTSISVQLHGAQTTIAAVYCPPNRAVSSNQFCTHFAELGAPWIASGDYNAKHTHWGSRLIAPCGRELMKAVNKLHGATFSGETPTYWPTDMEKTPDLFNFFIIKGVLKRSLLVHNVTDLSSDHSPIIDILKAAPASTQRPAPLTTKKTDWNKYREFLDHAISLKVCLKSAQELDSTVQLFTTALEEAAEVSTLRAQMAQSPTIEYPEYINCLVRQRRTARKKWQRTSSFVVYCNQLRFSTVVDL